MKILDRILRRKPEEKRYWLDASKIYHFYEDCPAIEGKSKLIGRYPWKYDLCKDCRDRHSAEMHQNAVDFDKNVDSYIAELVDNVGASELPEDEKTKALQFGLAYIFMARMTLHMLDSMGEVTGKVGG